MKRKSNPSPDEFQKLAKQYDTYKASIISLNKEIEFGKKNEKKLRIELRDEFSISTDKIEELECELSTQLEELRDKIISTGNELRKILNEQSVV